MTPVSLLPLSLPLSTPLQYIRPQLFKRWIALSAGWITIQRITQSFFGLDILWIAIYQVDDAIQRLTNWGLLSVLLSLRASCLPRVTSENARASCEAASGVSFAGLLAFDSRYPPCTGFYLGYLRGRSFPPKMPSFPPKNIVIITVYK